MHFSLIAHPVNVAPTTDPAVLSAQLGGDAVREFYRGRGARYTEVAQHFFNNISNPAFVATIA